MKKQVLFQEAGPAGHCQWPHSVQTGPCAPQVSHPCSGFNEFSPPRSGTLSSASSLRLSMSPALLHHLLGSPATRRTVCRPSGHSRFRLGQHCQQGNNCFTSPELRTFRKWHILINTYSLFKIQNCWHTFKRNE